MYVLDTDTWTLFLRNHPTVRQRVQAHQADYLAVTVITVEEQLSGWYTVLRRAKKRDDKARAYQRLTEAVAAFEGWRLLSFPEAAILRYEQLHAQKLNIGKKDLCIAAITLEQGGVVVTRNLRDFQRVPNLSVEDWTT